MDKWEKKAALEMLDSATTRRAVLAVAERARGKVTHDEWDEVWKYATLRFDRLPDDGTHMRDPEWGSLKTASKQSVRNWREGQPKVRDLLTRMALKEIIRTAMPFVVGVKSVTGDVPVEFQDWIVKGKMVDLHLEQLQLEDEFDQASANQLIGDFLIGSIVAIRKLGRWFLMSVNAADVRKLRQIVIQVEATTEENAARYYRLPDNWEQKVEISEENP